MSLITTIYILGALVTLIFLVVTFLIMNYRDETQGTWNDLGGSVLSVVLWPLFWIVLISSKILGRFF